MLTTALGGWAGYVPACNNEYLPLNILQKVFVDSYGLKRYIPTIMQPSHYSFETDKSPIYYSMQYPSTYIFSPKSRKISSTLSEMRELQHIMKIFISEVSKDKSMFSDTILHEAINKLEFKYYHNEVDKYKIIKLSDELQYSDPHFNFAIAKNTAAKFASDAKFFRGCVSITAK